MKLYTKNDIYKGRRICRFDGYPYTGGYSLDTGHPGPHKYGINLGCVGEDGKSYELWIDSDTLYRLNQVAEVIKKNHPNEF